MLSIAIVVYRSNIDILAKLLASIYTAKTSLPNAHKIDRISLLDNGNQTTQLERLISQFSNQLPELVLIRNKVNAGYGRAHNAAIKQSASKYHLILNPDVILDSQFFNKGLEYLEKHPECVAISPYAVDNFNKPQYLTKNYPSLFDFFLRGTRIKWLEKKFSSRLANYENRKLLANEQPGIVSIISGCCMLCRTDVLKTIGGFDERYFLYFEDFSLSLELGKYGEIIYLPTLKIIHFGGHAAGKGWRHRGYFIASGIRFFNQYGWKIL